MRSSYSASENESSLGESSDLQSSHKEDSWSEKHKRATPKRRKAIYKSEDDEEWMEDECIQKRKTKKDKKKSGLLPQPLPLTAVSTGKSFCRVPGRLSVVGTTRFFGVHLEEILRRVSMPEALNKSTLGPMLRRGKNRGCGDELQEMLLLNGVCLESNRRKASVMCTLTTLTEEEAATLATDCHNILFEYFPFEALARLLTARTPSNALQERIEMMEAVKVLVDEMLSVHADVCDVPNMPATLSSPRCLLRGFSLMTHCFGIIEWKTHALALRSFADHSIKVCREQMTVDEEERETEDEAASRFNTEYRHLAEMGEEGLPEMEPDAVFTEVPGRLSITHRKYCIRMAEIHRRLSPPECLNGSVLGAVLRKSKTRDNIPELRAALAMRGIALPEGRRKMNTLSTLTSLVEEESIILARDMDDLITSFFPVKKIAELCLEHAEIRDSDRKLQLCYLKTVCSELHALVQSMELPCGDHRPLFTSPYAHLLIPYSNMTHGFGPEEIKSWLLLFMRLAEQGFNIPC